MDECELSSQHEDLYRRMAIDEARRRKTDMASCAECIDCGAPIPEARRRAVPGCTRCVFCQEAFERTNP